MSELRRFGGAQDAPAPVTYELASWGVRAWAYLIDLLVLLGLCIVVAAGAVIAEGDTEQARRLAQTLGLAVATPLWLAYAPLLLMRRGERNGQTLGKQAMRIRVVRENGEPVTLGNGALREIIGRQLLVAFTYGLYAVVDYAWPWWDKPRQCLHDKVAQTRVVLLTPLSADAVASFTTGVDAHAPDQPVAQDQPTSGRSTPLPPPPAPPVDDAPVRDGWLPPTSGR
ncbi:RDD family protein [Conexibacter sp. CPCC 206217]|uniref:RDD family protein n=1 Tax=Conexibacter sp. CPCC 206217 TaxID=3064574 RepID=UPI0027290DE9|nr:RDD family protein [Conexibacter sp. CPCC 206217]MDO8209984.1 RDD family protein [Conexibacter sp. CPCC 206217]